MKNINHIIVINPQTENKGQRDLSQLINALLKKDLSYDVFQTKADTQLTEKELKEMLHNYSDVVSIEGDGSLNMLSNVLAFKNIALGIIPCGTGNDFKKNEATFMASFGNGSYFGNGMNITPNADITDGLLDCCWVGKLGFVKKVHCLIKLYAGEHLSTNNIKYVQGKQFEVLSERQPIEADGEFIGLTLAMISSEEGALLLKVP